MLQLTPTRFYMDPYSNSSLTNMMDALDIFRPSRERIRNQRSLFKISDESENVTYSLIVPGVTKDKFEISIKKNVLKVDWHEEGYEHSQSVVLRNDLDFDQTVAKLENGILSVIVAKEKPETDKIIKIQ